MDTLDYKEPITKIYFVRHGETKANRERLLFGQLDLDLTEEGIKQAKHVAKKLSKVKTDLIISSPLKRAKHTTDIIARKLNVKKTILDKNLMEKSEGLWEGKNYWQIREEDPKGYKHWLKAPFTNRPPKGESVLDLDKRVNKFYKLILNKYKGKHIIVVCHSGPIRLFVLRLLKANIDKFWHLKIEHCSVTEVHLSKKHAIVWSVNRIF